MISVSADEILSTLECTPPATVDSGVCYTLSDNYGWYANGQLKQNLPLRYHYSNNERIEDVIVTMVQPWEVSK